jgi:hypothetical protein
VFRNDDALEQLRNATATTVLPTCTIVIATWIEDETDATG